ncbi:MAG: hypothetical protein ACKOCW_01225 [Planctomycetaceae bacterium]
MNTPSGQLPSEAELKALVAEVIARLRAGTAGGPVAPSAPSPAATGIVGEAVVTLALVERLPAGTVRVQIGPRAVVTPSARERLADRGIAIDRAAPGIAGAAPCRPFFLARIDCPAAKGPQGAAATSARIARAVPGSQHLPATGIADVLAALALHAARDGARGMILSPRAATVLVLANRSKVLRAVGGRDVAAVLAAARETAANLVVVNPGELSAVALERVAVEFARRADGPLPPELVVAAEGCGCRTH